MIQQFSLEEVNELTPQNKGILVNVLHQDVPRLKAGEAEGISTVIAAAEATVMSLSVCMGNKQEALVMPGMPFNDSKLERP